MIALMSMNAANKVNSWLLGVFVSRCGLSGRNQRPQIGLGGRGYACTQSEQFPTLSPGKEGVIAGQLELRISLFSRKDCGNSFELFLAIQLEQWHFQKPNTVHSDQLKKLSKHDWAGWENLRLIRFARHVDWHVGWQQPVVQRGISGLWYEWLAYKKMAES